MAHEHAPDDVRAVTLRMKRAHGHLARVIAMMEEGSDWEPVLVQLAAVNKAISRSGYALVAHCLQHCVQDGDGLDELDAQRIEKLFLALA